MAVQVRTKDTTTAFTTCGHQLIPWWRKIAPSTSCTYRTKIESKVSVNRAGLRVSNSIRGCSSIRCQCQDPQPAALLHSPSPDCEDKREKPGYLRDHAMDVLKPHSTHQLRNLVPGAERRWPVRYGQSGVIAGYQRASNEEQKSPAGKGHRKPVVPLVIRSGDELQNVLLGHPFRLFRYRTGGLQRVIQPSI